MYHPKISQIWIFLNFIRYISVMWLDDDDKEFNNDKETLHLQKNKLGHVDPLLFI